MTLLGISIGTTRSGVCVLKDGEILDREIHNFFDEWSKAKLNLIINRYRQYFQKRSIDAIIINVPPLKRHNDKIRAIMKRIEVLAKEHLCEFDLTTKTEMKHITGVRSTEELIKYTTLLYPELRFVYEKGQENDHGHYKKLFEAVLCAHIYRKRQLQRAQQIYNATE